MGVRLRGRASQVLLWGALIVIAVSTHGPVIEAQEPAMRWDGLIELISGRNDMPPPSMNPPIPANGPSQMSRHAVSGDGRSVVFTATAPSLAGFPGPAVYLRDRRMSDTRVLFAGLDTTGLRDAVISEDGRHVAFTVCEPLMRPDSAPICDVWAQDTQTGGWSPLSVAPSTGEFGNADSDEPVLSSSGRFVVFRTAATNLAPGVPAGVPQIVIKDRDPDQNGIYDEPGPVSPNSFQIVSAPKGAAGTVPGNGPSATADVSDNGRYVAFRSAATNLVPGDTNGAWDVFRRDRMARDTRRLNVPSGSSQSAHPIDSPGISMTPDGRYVAFASADPTLAPGSFGDTNNARDVYIFDAQSLSVERVDVGWLASAPGVHPPGSGPTDWPTLSSDGRYVSVQSEAMNVEMPPPPNSSHSYVIDRAMRTVTRVSIKPDGTDPDRSCVRPAISADGSLVAFVSQAFNLTPNAYTDADRVYAAVHLEITPQERSVAGGAGGAATYDVVTQQHTPWWIDWHEWQSWTDFETPPMGVGSGMLKIRANEPNPAPTPRTATIKIFDKSVRFIQLAGLSLTGISPAAGPDTGGTQVTFTGTGFDPGMRVVFDGLEATAIQFVDSTTFIATAPPHAPATVWVGVFAASPDNRVAWIDNAFRYRDTTPPQLWYGFSDNPNENGWFNRDVTLNWAWMDNETPVTSTSGCDAAVIAVDTPGTTYTCTATSEGGTSSLSAFVKRDATAPTATITSPAFRLYDLGEVVQPAFTCSDALSGVASCVGGTNGEPIDTATSGYHTFGVSIRDRADNPWYVAVDYAVGSGVCAYPLPDMVAWWRMEGNTSNARSNLTTNATRVGLTSDVFVGAVVGQGYQFEGADGYLLANDSPAMLSDKKLAFAAWVKPSADTRGTIMRARDFFGVARLETGNIGWAFRKSNDATLSYRDTGVALPLGQWSHVVVMLDGFEVRTYLNGRLAHTEPNVGDVINPSSYPVTLGGADNVGDYFKGVLDELQIFQHGLNDYEIEQLFLAGSAGACVPKRTSFQIVEPIPASFGSQTYAFDVRLVAEDGTPVAGRTVELVSQVGASPSSSSSATRTTDGDGRVHWDAPLMNAPRGLYESLASATFTGDADYVRTSASADVLVGPATPTVTVTGGTFTYDGRPHGASVIVTGIGGVELEGALLTYDGSVDVPVNAGTYTAVATFDGSGDYGQASGSAVVTILKATAVLGWNRPGPIVYGTPLGGDELNATADVFGSFDYSPAAGTVLNAGASQTLTATFTPSDPANYIGGTVNTTIDVSKALAEVTAIGGTFTYDGQPHPASGFVTGVAGAPLGTPTFTYNGSSQAPVTVGNYEVVASFAGNANYQPASATTAILIMPAAPVLDWTQPQPIVYGTALGDAQLNATASVPGTFTYSPAAGTVLNAGASQVLTATFTPSDPNYSGYGIVITAIDVSKASPILNWSQPAAIVHGTPLGAGQLNATASVAGSFSYSPAAGTVLNAGASQALTATFTPADSGNYSSGSVTATIDVSKATATVSAVGGTFTYDGQPHPATGSVTGLAGASIGTPSFTYNGSAQAPVAAGSYAVVATFAGNANYEPASASATIVVSAAPLSIRANDAAKPFGAPLPLFTASAAGFVNGDSFASLGGVLAFATSATAQSAVGTYPVVPSGLGSPNYVITFVPGTLTVVRGGVTVSVSTSPAPSGLNQPMTFTANVSAAAPAAGMPGGTVRFFDGATPLGSSTLSGVSASFTTAGLTAGLHTIEARYDGDASFEIGSGSAPHTVNGADATPSITIASNRNPSSVGQSVTLTANLSMASGPVSGTVQFYDGAALLDTPTIVSGSATFTTTSLAAGSHAITVRYLGSASAPPVISTVFVQAVGAPGWKNRTSSTTLSASPSPSAPGAPVTLTANVSGSNGTPAGAVLFMVNGEVVGGPVTLTAISGSTAQATMVLPSLPGGRHIVTATYLGSSNYKGSTAAITQTVN
jgi:Concanavalin A-like lectin/glucanases superfamily/MBG domain (YGX type)/Bacterial Ig-like domain (group 3)/IPT/TIG domain/MBG domain